MQKLSQEIIIYGYVTYVTEQCQPELKQMEISVKLTSNCFVQSE